MDLIDGVLSLLLLIAGAARLSFRIGRWARNGPLAAIGRHVARRGARIDLRRWEAWPRALLAVGVAGRLAVEGPARRLGQILLVLAVLLPLIVTYSRVRRERCGPSSTGLPCIEGPTRRDRRREGQPAVTRVMPEATHKAREFTWAMENLALWDDEGEPTALWYERGAVNTETCLSIAGPLTTWKCPRKCSTPLVRSRCAFTVLPPI